MTKDKQALELGKLRLEERSLQTELACYDSKLDRYIKAVRAVGAALNHSREAGWSRSNEGALYVGENRYPEGHELLEALKGRKETAAALARVMRRRNAAMGNE